MVSRTKFLVAVASICRYWRSFWCCSVVDVGTNDGGVVRRECRGGGLLSLLLALTFGLCCRFCRAMLIGLRLRRLLHRLEIMVCDGIPSRMLLADFEGKCSKEHF